MLLLKSLSHHRINYLIGRYILAEVLGEAAALEKEYDWGGAKDLYEQALSAVDEGDYLRRGEIQER